MRKADIQGNKAFHTSARSLSSPRKPVESDLQGEQNEHLKHKDASDKDSGKGNAAPEPHLPSQQANKGSATATKNNANPAQSGKASGAPKGFVAYHTSAVRWGQKEREGPGYAGTHTGEPNRAGKVCTDTSLIVKICLPKTKAVIDRRETVPTWPSATLARPVISSCLAEYCCRIILSILLKSLPC